MKKKNMSRMSLLFPICFDFSPSHEDLKALIAQAHRSVYKCDTSPIITDLIDNIMSIPSCLQDAKSKVTLVREWIKQVIQHLNLYLLKKFYIITWFYFLFAWWKYERGCKFQLIETTISIHKIFILKDYCMKVINQIKKDC